MQGINLSIAALVFALHGPCAAGEPLACEGARKGPDAGELSCRVDGAAAHTLLVFAGFSGVHDDSQASIAARLDGEPVRCEPGARQQLRGENEGDQLQCRFTPPAQAVARERTLRVLVTWHHAQPERVAVTRED